MKKVFAVLSGLSLTVGAQAPVDLPLVPALLETASTLKNPSGRNGDMDDPAIWVHPSDAQKSLVVAARKNAGLAVYDLKGNTVGDFPTPEGGRYNNVEVIYGLNRLGRRVDVAVATDRGLDRLVAWEFNPETLKLESIPVDPAMGMLFSSPDTLSEQKSAYGIASWKDVLRDETFVFVTQRNSPRVAQFRLRFDAGGALQWEPIRTLDFPTQMNGWAPENTQLEGMVVDARSGRVYAAQESFGIWTFPAQPSPESPEKPELVLATRSVPGHDQSPIAPDAEGLTLFHGKWGKGWLLASSQGDSTYVALDLDTLKPVAHWRMGLPDASSNGYDFVQETDGAHIEPLYMGPLYPKGLFVVQDGKNTPKHPSCTGKCNDTNLKFVSVESLRGVLPGFDEVWSGAWDPRHPGLRLSPTLEKDGSGQWVVKLSPNSAIGPEGLKGESVKWSLGSTRVSLDKKSVSVWALPRKLTDSLCQKKPLERELRFQAQTLKGGVMALGHLDLSPLCLYPSVAPSAGN